MTTDQHKRGPLIRPYKQGERVPSLRAAPNTTDCIVCSLDITSLTACFPLCLWRIGGQRRVVRVANSDSAAQGLPQAGVLDAVRIPVPSPLECYPAYQGTGEGRLSGSYCAPGGV